tara:strand:+ start:239 stop:505 length:267 start_codon:yes stop_codon:yes gene_type:complete
MSILIHEKKYLCIGNDKVQAEWLPRWYGVPFEECLFIQSELPNRVDLTLKEYRYVNESVSLIKLRVLPKNSDYKKQLCILKTEKLLWQ